MPVAGLVIVILVVLWLVAAFNKLVRGRNFMREAWSGIDVQLKRRYNLIPNLVQTVQGYAQHERKLFEEVTALRTRCMRATSAAEKAGPESALSRMLKNLLVVVENYPDLKANQNFLELQSELSETEDDIQMARRYYNGTVRNYNNRVESFPSMIVARLFAFKGGDFFEIEYATERAVPEVAMQDSS